MRNRLKYYCFVLENLHFKSEPVRQIHKHRRVWDAIIMHTFASSQCGSRLAYILYRHTTHLHKLYSALRLKKKKRFIEICYKSWCLYYSVS